MEKLLRKVTEKAKGNGNGSYLNSGGGGDGKRQGVGEWQEHAWNAEPDHRQIYAYRQQRGVNLGSLFTLESWLTPSLFQDVKGGAKSEFDICQRSTDIKALKQHLERHWSTFVDQGDWAWMVDNGINTVRVPISYYHFLPGHPEASVRALINDTEYAPFAALYQSAFEYIVKTIQIAAQHHIGVLIDLHGAPGGQNDQDHCGLSTGKADFFQHAKHRRKTTAILVALADTLTKFDNVVGLELLNEPQNHGKLPEWYAEAVRAICSRHGARLPLYLGDCWSTEQYATMLRQNRNAGFLVMDHHLYRCFTSQDHAKSAQQHADEVHPAGNGASKELLRKAADTLQGNIVIGEWSAALHHTSLQGGDARQGQQSWANAQLQAYGHVCAGSFFWTLKKEGPPDAGWCLYSAIEEGVLPKGLGRPSKSARSAEELQRFGKEEGKRAYDGHVSYWNGHSEGRPMHHDRFLAGFEQIWHDCMAFYAADQSTIGFAGRWIEQRARAQSRDVGADGEWEFEHGAKQALNAFAKAVQ